MKPDKTIALKDGDKVYGEITTRHYKGGYSQCGGWFMLPPPNPTEQEYIEFFQNRLDEARIK